MFIFDLFKAFLAWAVIFPVLFLVGSWFHAWVRVEDVLLRGILYCAIGMAVLSYSLVLFSAAHLLNPQAIWILLFSLFILGSKRLREWLSWMKSVIRNLLDVSNRKQKLFPAIFVLSFFAVLMGALSPEIGGDALAYHLNLPKVFLLKGSLAPDYFDLNSFFPLFSNNLYLTGLAVGGPLAAKLFHFVCGFFLFLTVKVIVFRQTKDAGISYFFALVIWLTPLIYHMISTTYIDVGLTFFTFLSLVTLTIAFEESHRATFFLSGFFIGCAVAIKYLALISVLALVGVWMTQFVLNRRLFRAGTAFSVWMFGAIVGGGYWYFRNWILTGNPFFPFFSGLFGTEPLVGTHYGIYGAGKGLLDFISIFWNMLVHPALFGSFSDRIGPFYFLFLPFVGLAVFFAPASRPYALFSLFFLVGWFFVSQIDRFMVPALPAVSMAAALGFSWFYAHMISQTGAAFKFSVVSLGIFLLMFELLAGLRHYRYSYLLFLGRWSPSEYLRRLERTVPAASWMNQNLPSTAKILLETEPRRFYIDRPIVRDFYLRYRTHYDRRDWTPSALRDFLKSFGITHVLINEPVDRQAGANTLTPLRGLVESPFSEKLMTIRSENVRDAQYLYRIYQLN